MLKFLVCAGLASGTIIASGGGPQLAMVGISEAAEPSNIDSLITERAAIEQSIEVLAKQFADNAEAFEKLPSTIEYNEKQTALRKAYGEADTKIRAIDAAIVELVVKEKK